MKETNFFIYKIAHLIKFFIKTLIYSEQRHYNKQHCSPGVVPGWAFSIYGHISPYIWVTLNRFMHKYARFFVIWPKGFEGTIEDLLRLGTVTGTLRRFVELKGDCPEPTEPFAGKFSVPPEELFR
jgi:hypothetical protein